MHKDLLELILEFEWDAGNADKSRRKHGVTIEEAEQVFLNDPFILQADTQHSDKEKRLQAFGMADNGKRLLVAFTIRNRKVRIISARQMNKKEREMHEKET